MENLKYYKQKILNYYKISEDDLNKLFNKETDLDKYWYDTGEKDTTFYEMIEYVAIAFKTFERYSKTCCICCKKFFTEDNYKILDFGAGIGLTTYLLSELFPKSTVYYNNLKGEQWKFAESLLKDRTNVKFTENVDKCDIVMASELFEHIKEPIALLDTFMNIADPKYIVVSNSFGSNAYGHFSQFTVGEQSIDRKKIGRVFNKALRTSGYYKAKIFWNGRPTVWQKS